MTKFWLACAFMALLTPPAWGAFGVRPNIYKGAFNVAGSLTFGGDQYGNSIMTADTNTEYFMTHQWGVGAELVINSVGNGSSYLFGPTADYFFYLDGRLAASGGGALLYYNGSLSGVGGGS